MGILEWATSPSGQRVPIHIAWFLIWVALIVGLMFLVVHAIYVRYFAGHKEFAADSSADARNAAVAARTDTQTASQVVGLSVFMFVLSRVPGVSATGTFHERAARHAA